jgi:hypothetical protein
LRPIGRETGISQRLNKAHDDLTTHDETRIVDMYEEMTSLERCIATIRLQPHDRVPVDLHNFMMTLIGSNLPPMKLYTDGQLLGEAQT